MREILSDLVAEQQALDQFLQGVRERDWKRQTRSDGWTILDIVSHLAATEEVAARVIAEGQPIVDEIRGVPFDDWTHLGVERGRGRRYQEIIEWWRNGRAGVVEPLSRMDSEARIPWFVATVNAKTFATLRLAETWAHGLDIKHTMDDKIVVEEDEEDPRDDTPRIRHIAWLAHRMLPWAYNEVGAEFPAEGIRIEIMGPKYALWTFGPKDSPHVIKGRAGDFCRIAVHRPPSEDSQLRTSSEVAAESLTIVRTY
ncbi:MAG: maleylpyruvate isomerase family mycothiol-dependent enzyme [Actinobacteria bacterium]|nr:maleylpyruvate isomerase family mycothiol-dependent enzyme [Actinomycetota bacterium]